VARMPADQLDDRILEDLVLDAKSGMLRAVFSGGLELRALGAEAGEERAWYVRDLEANWLLTGSATGLRLEPDV
jgi:hypothetical protein